MFAIIETGGKQYKVAPGVSVSVEKIVAEPGETVEFDRVLMVGNDDGVSVGSPLVSGAKVVAHVIDQHRGERISVYKFKAKSNYHRRTGHRQYYTHLRVAEIVTA
jgi:large subunit ribosomal protein L21